MHTFVRAITNNISDTQPPKDWQLLLAVGVIVLVDVCIAVPLVTLSRLNGSITPTVDIEKDSRLNVSDYDAGMLV